jgi:hypothetical protein
MNYLSSFKQLSRAKQIAVLLIVSTFTWAVGVPTFFATASAAQLSLVSATASSSVPAAVTNMTLRYTSTTTVSTGQTIAIQFSPGHNGGTDEYSLASLTVNDVVGQAGVTVITAACGAVTANQVSISGGIANAAGNRTVTLTACGAVAAQQITIGFINNHLVNPTTTGSYKITIGGTQTDSGTAMTAILNQVTVTASVDATLTFTVSGVAAGQSINNEQVSTTSTAVAIGFGTLASGTPVVAAQDLTVATNAQNGFIVTVHEDQNLLSANGADIDLFQDGNAVATPIAWATPTAVLGTEATYGHMGITSNDTDLNANEFFSGSVIKWAGNFYPTTTRTIFSNTGPADGVTQNIGRARVGYKILVSNLQEAATDYTNHLIYVCTPTF